MKKHVLLMSFLALLSFGCSEIENDAKTESTTQHLDQNRSNYSNDGSYITKQNFTIDLEKLRNSTAGLTRQQFRTGDKCPDPNTNTNYVLGNVRVGEQINFVYSSHFEPDLAYNNGPKQNGESKIFHAVKRGLNTVENAIKELNTTNGQQKKHNLFTIEFTDAPLYDDHSNMTLSHGAHNVLPLQNNYGGWDFSNDGINSIAWVDFGKDSDAPEIRQKIAGNVYTVWDRNGYILERDIILQNNEFLSWAIKSDLTSKKGGAVDCNPQIDIQAVITHFALQTVGLRPLHDNIAFEGNDATIFKITGFGYGPYVLTNDPGAWHPHSWQTLTPGDKQGAWEAAPENGFVMVPDITPVPDANQLILHYDFDEDLSSGIVSDQSGNNLDGNIVGALQIETGIRNSAARFANNSYIDLDGENFPGEKLPLTGYTIGAWIKSDQGSFDASFAPTIFKAANHMGNDLENIFLPFGHRVILGSTTSIPFVAGPVVNTTVIEDQWFHYVVTFDVVSGEYAMYIDGITLFEGVAPVSDPGTLSRLPSNPVGTTLIDNWDFSAKIGAWASSGPDPFIGLMDDFVLYNYALSASDIDNLKTNGPGAVNNP